MAWWVLFNLLFLQTPVISGTEELWGESTIPQVKDWQSVRENARTAGLETVLRELWTKRAAPALFVGTPPAEVERIQKLVLSKKTTFLIGLSNIQENRSSSGAYTFRALYQIDVAGFMREIKRLLLSVKPHTVNVYLDASEPPWIASDWTSQISQPGLACVVKTEKMPGTGCPADFCIQAKSQRTEEGWEASIFLRRIQTIQGPAPRRGPKPKPVTTLTEKTFSTVAPVLQSLYQQLPAELLSMLGVTPTLAVQIQSPGTLDFSAWLQVLFLIQRQEPEVVALRTIGLLSGRNTAVLHVRQAPGGADVWFKGLYFGKNVKVTWNKRVDGVFELRLETTPASVETRTQGN